MRNPVHIALVLAAVLALAGVSENCGAQIDAKALDVKAIGEIVGIRNWAEERNRARTEKLNKVIAIFWQQVDASGPSIPVQARRELDAAAKEYIASAQADETAEQIVHLWEESLGKQLSSTEASSLRAFYESPLGENLLKSMAFANSTVAEHINTTTERRMNDAYRRLLELAASIQEKYLSNGKAETAH